jgi:hypothetical protein
MVIFRRIRLALVANDRTDIAPGVHAAHWPFVFSKPQTMPGESGSVVATVAANVRIVEQKFFIQHGVFILNLDMAITVYRATV